MEDFSKILLRLVWIAKGVAQFVWKIMYSNLVTYCVRLSHM